MKIKNILIMLIFLNVLSLSACATESVDGDLEYITNNTSLNIISTGDATGDATGDDIDQASNVEMTSRSESRIIYLPFEEILAEATDIVIAEYIGRRQFSPYLTEFEFVVVERVLGNAQDRILIYSEDVQHRFRYSNLGNLDFNTGTNYLLTLDLITSPYAHTPDGGFMLISNIAIDLSNPSYSIQYISPLQSEIDGLDFSKVDISGNDIVSFIRDLTRDNELVERPVMPLEMEDIINESPYIVLIEIDEVLRLSHEQVTRAWFSTDMYYVTILSVLKGDIPENEKIVVSFFANTVSLGEKHIVAIQPISEGSYWYRFTSRYSLFSIDQYDEIMQIIAQQQ